MPLYAGGDLWQWSTSSPRSSADKLVVLRHALVGLEHVHRCGIVHADVKPENIFVDSNGVGKLGDFDVSKDDATRVTLVGRDATVIGFSLMYLAPELQDVGRVGVNVRATRNSDVYAFGLTLFDVMIGEKRTKSELDFKQLSQHEPSVNGDSLQTLAKAMLVSDPSKRVSATDALMLGAFAPVPPGRDPESDRRKCQICFDDFWLDEGIGCSNAHFHCRTCLKGFCEMFNGLSLAEVARRGALGCGVHECNSPNWSPAELARSLPEDKFQEYLNKLNQV